MNTKPTPQQLPTPTPEEAQAALQQASSSQVVPSKDRLTYGALYAACGLLLGGLVAASSATQGGPGLLPAFVALAILALSNWQKASSRSVPRGALRAGWVGMGVTVVVILAVVMGLNWNGQDVPNPAWLLVLAGLVTAVPLVVTGLVIARRSR